MDKTENSGMEQKEQGTTDAALAANAPAGAIPEGSERTDPPFHGFDEAGEYFVVRVHKSFGYIFILGWLIKAADWLKMHIAQQAMAAKQEKLIKPKGFRGFGKINLFK